MGVRFSVSTIEIRAPINAVSSQECRRPSIIALKCGRLRASKQSQRQVAPASSSMCPVHTRRSVQLASRAVLLIMIMNTSLQVEIPCALSVVMLQATSVSTHTAINWCRIHRGKASGYTNRLGKPVQGAFTNSLWAIGMWPRTLGGATGRLVVCTEPGQPCTGSTKQRRQDAVYRSNSREKLYEIVLTSCRHLNRQKTQCRRRLESGQPESGLRPS